MDLFEGIIFLIQFMIKLPAHLIHLFTYGKYVDEEPDKTTYKTIGLIFMVFSLLGLAVWLLILFTERITC